MGLKSFLRPILIGLLAGASFHASAASVTVSISSGGNVNSKGVVEAWCLNSGKSCKVVGNRPHHPGPRSCSMTCQTDEIFVWSCEPNNDDRWIDDIPSSLEGETSVVSNGNRMVYSKILTGSIHAGCSFTD
ncbi:hypothetical protein [Marinibactrum halimedae]|uniref:Secreted protein n=1 Tax=Marinibactrum halimedae TaxID=1444977 RepID=A0AA37T9P6_9GAMM|nr:hypothetical protein [Marinibactrum halimedae]MCD9460799.1 hypothetical protein [Marinibactrum halimedae]GLS27388.1 hypothetical protein GCM10007877_31070 [Marinibactrum halimedae]